MMQVVLYVCFKRLLLVNESDFKFGSFYELVNKSFLETKELLRTTFTWTIRLLHQMLD